MKIQVFPIHLAFILMLTPFVGNAADSSLPKDMISIEYAWLFKLLVGFLLVAVLSSWVLWVINREMSAELKIRTEAQKQLRLANQRILRQAYTDDLTGMGNRRSFYEKAEAEIELARLDGTELSVLLIDIDHFKNINDRYGHGVGDRVIRRLAKIILQVVRANDVQGRIGGEEFAVIATKTSLEGARELAERMRSSVEEFDFMSDLFPIKMTVSVGVADFHPDHDDIHSIVARADDSLYQAKYLGRNRVVLNHDQPAKMFPTFPKALIQMGRA